MRLSPAPHAGNVRVLLLTLLTLVAATPPVAAQVSNKLLVSSFDSGEILAIDPQSGAVTTFVAPGTGLSRPTGIVFGPDGNLYVGNSTTAGAVFRFNGTTGTLIDAFIPAGSGGLVFPEQILFGPEGNLYIASNDPGGNHSIKRYDGATGAFIDTFVTPGSGGLHTPLGMTFGPDGNLYVVSSVTSSILRYNGRTGAFIDVFIAAGSGGLSFPWAVLFGPDGHAYVSSTGNDKVLRYNGTTGAFLNEFVSPGNGLTMPTDITFTSDGRFLVAAGVGTDSRILRYDGTTGAFINALASSPSGGLSFPTFMSFSPDRQCPQSTADTDGDGLLDCWERDGVDANRDGTIDLRLYDMNGDGTVDPSERPNPFHKDVYVEVDWMELHQPDPNTLQAVVTAFANSPVANPDRVPGVRLHVFVNEQAAAHSPLMTYRPRCSFTAGPVDFDNIKAAAFGTAAERAGSNAPNVREAKRRTFRYALYAHQLTGCTTLSGIAELPGNDFIITIPGWTAQEGNGSFDHQAGTFMHELGHTLGLTHGGGYDDAITRTSYNCKQNYLSVMNYIYQFDGLWVNGRPLDYSRFKLPDLDKAALQEANGIGCATPGACPANPRVTWGPPRSNGSIDGRALDEDASGAIDWNLSGAATDTNVTRALNNLGFSGCNGAGSVLKGFDDWSNLLFNFRLTTDYADGIHGSSGEEMDVDEVLPVSPDTDEDGVPNVRDNCPTTPNADQADRNNNFLGDACDDISAPVINGSRTPAPNANGWNSGDVAVTFACADAATPPFATGIKDLSASGAASGSSAASPLTVVITGEGAGLEVTGTCTDNAGNAAQTTVSNISIDRTPPAVAVAGVSQGAVYIVGAVPVASCTTTDALSGVATPATLVTTGGTANGVGTFAATCDGAVDRAGNQAPPVSVGYSVRYAFTGFLPPLSGESYAGIFKLGRTIPVKWTLADASGGWIGALSAVESIQLAANSGCAGDADGTPFDPGSTSAVGLRYDAVANQYVFNWQTSGLAAGCYTLAVKLDDGTTHGTTLRLR